MTGPRADQVTDLVGGVFDLLDGVWQPVRGRRRAVGLYRAAVLRLFLMRRNEAQAVASEQFGCSHSTVSRIARRLRPLLRQATCDNSTRAPVERAIAHLVNWKVLDTGWRGRLTGFPEILRTVPDWKSTKPGTTTF